MSNSNNQKEAKVFGMGFPGWLTLLFITLKLTGYIAWNWIWVLSPLWISVAIILLFVILF